MEERSAGVGLDAEDAAEGFAARGFMTTQVDSRPRSDPKPSMIAARPEAMIRKIRTGR